MSYQILARKYRPKRFAELIGHKGIRNVLENALDRKKIHHTYLLTGMHGVGKTSLARLLAKCLSCESGITSCPCGECANCMAIQKNQFVDLIEVDAASRTRIEDTQSLLENVQYKPVLGRYKIYLIDEVHMLSMHSFNALLKTLEEPPSHVTFLLATTDIQRVPETIISRCLHLPLKALSLQEIIEQLAQILEKENVTHYDSLALKKIAQLAKGSMRDALSLLEPVILHGKMNQVRLKDVEAIFGYLDVDYEIALINAIHNRQIDGLLRIIQRLSEASISFEQVLDNLIEHFYQIALAQQIDVRTQKDNIFLPDLIALSKQLTPEEAQLYYQMALTGKKDLCFSPTSELGFKMIMLRMVAFTQVIERNPLTEDVAPVNNTIVEAIKSSTERLDWPVLAYQLPLTGFLRELALHSSLEKFESDTIYLLLHSRKKALYSKEREQSLEEAISQHLKKVIHLHISISDALQTTPAMLTQAQQHHAQQMIYKNVLENEGVKAIQAQFNATLEADDIKSIS